MGINMHVLSSLSCCTGVIWTLSFKNIAGSEHLASAEAFGLQCPRTGVKCGSSNSLSQQRIGIQVVHM